MKVSNLFMNPDILLLRLSESILGKVLSSKLTELCSKPFCTLSTSVHMCRVWKVLNWSRYRRKNIKIRILIRKYLEISNPFSEWNYLQPPSISNGAKIAFLTLDVLTLKTPNRISPYQPMTHPCSFEKTIHRTWILCLLGRNKIGIL